MGLQTPEAPTKTLSSPLAGRSGIGGYGRRIFWVVLAATLLFVASTSPFVRAIGYTWAADRALSRQPPDTKAATAALEQASAALPDDTALRRRLARLQLQMGHDEQGIALLRAIADQEPASRLVQAELAEALDATSDHKAALAIWRSMGAGPDQMVSAGNKELFIYKDAANALLWYERAERMGADPQAVAGNRQIAEILTSRSAGANALPTELYELTDSLDVPVVALRLLPGGEPLYPGADPSLAILWSDGAAYVAVNVVKTGQYRLTVEAQHSTPAPVQFQIEHNFSPVATFALGRGDNNWESSIADLYLEEGIHLLGVRFTNDLSGPDGTDRNLIMKQIRIQVLTP